MHSISYFWHLSRLIYGPRNFQENKRAVVFFARAVSNRALFEELYDFFDHYEPMKGFFDQHDPDFQEVMTRVFLFKNSTMRQRLDALKHHFTILRTFVSDDVIHERYWGNGYTLWTSPDESLPLEARLIFDTGQRKEGFLSLYLYHEGQMIYHFNFRFDYNADGTPSMYIGTIQGSKHGLETTKVLTKKLFGYRPKKFHPLSHAYLLSRHWAYTICTSSPMKASIPTVICCEATARRRPISMISGQVKVPCPDSKEQWYFRLPIEEKRRKYGEIKSQKRNLFASAIFSWTPSFHRILPPSGPCSARTSIPSRRLSMKPLLQINRLITIPSKHQ